MKRSLSIAVCLGVLAGFIGCCLMGRRAERESRFENFLRIHAFLEAESSYYPTASQLVATARELCPPDSGRTLVVIGGNSVFNGSGQKSRDLWSRALQAELGGNYHVINFAAPGAGVVDNGAIVYEALSRDYPRLVLVTNTEPGNYAPGYESSYSYLFWDAYYKGMLQSDPVRDSAMARDVKAHDWQEKRLTYRLNSRLYFNDLWTGLAYSHASTVWTSWLKGRSFYPRRRLPDWEDGRPVVEPGEKRFTQVQAGHLGSLRQRKMVDPARFYQEAGGRWNQAPESLREDAERIDALLPVSLRSKALIVFTPINPWFLGRLTPEERTRVEISYASGVKLVEEGGFSGISLLDKGFESLEFGDSIHLSAAGGRRLAKTLAPAVRALAGEKEPLSRP